MRWMVRVIVIDSKYLTASQILEIAEMIYLHLWRPIDTNVRFYNRLLSADEIYQILDEYSDILKKGKIPIVSYFKDEKISEKAEELFAHLAEDIKMEQSRILKELVIVTDDKELTKGAEEYIKINATVRDMEERIIGVMGYYVCNVGRPFKTFEHAIIIWKLMPGWQVLF